MEPQLFDLLLALLPALLVGGIAFYFFNLHIFLERIAPGNLLLRIVPISDNKEAYEQLLTQTIEQEYDHNIAQQIYISDECWNIIRTAKNTTITLIRKTKNKEEVTNSDDLRKAILTKLMDNTTPSDAALEYIKREVGEIF